MMAQVAKVLDMQAWWLSLEEPIPESCLLASIWHACTSACTYTLSFSLFLPHLSHTHQINRISQVYFSVLLNCHPKKGPPLRSHFSMICYYYIYKKNPKAANSHQNLMLMQAAAVLCPGTPPPINGPYPEPSPVCRTDNLSLYTPSLL